MTFDYSEFTHWIGESLVAGLNKHVDLYLPNHMQKRSEGHFRWFCQSFLPQVGTAMHLG